MIYIKNEYFKKKIQKFSEEQSIIKYRIIFKKKFLSSFFCFK